MGLSLLIDDNTMNTRSAIMDVTFLTRLLGVVPEGRRKGRSGGVM